MENLKSKTTTQLIQLSQTVKDFCEERDWDQFHSPKNVAIGIVTEAAELLDLFRFLNKKEQKATIKNQRELVEDEVGDIFFMLLRFCQLNKIDLQDAFLRKLSKTGRRYPVERARGSNRKYNR